jgi:hypothetical protein
MGLPITGIFTAGFNQGYSGYARGALTSYSGVGGGGQGGGAVGGGGCLSSGTFILNEYKQSVPIYSINLGDKVMSLYSENNEYKIGISVVNNIIRDKYYYYYEINGKELEITYEHPLFINRTGTWEFKPVKDLIIGDVLYTGNNQGKKIHSIVRINKELQTWNFTTTYGNYFAGNSGQYLCHNATYKD